MSGGSQACAACRYQRRKCAPKCPLAPFFPPEAHRQFLNAHRLFGVSNINKIIRNLDSPRKEIAMRSIIFQANARASDPVGGCYRVICDLHRQIAAASAELDLVLHQISLCRQQQEQQQEQQQQEQQHMMMMMVPQNHHRHPHHVHASPDDFNQPPDAAEAACNNDNDIGGAMSEEDAAAAEQGLYYPVKMETRNDQLFSGQGKQPCFVDVDSEEIKPFFAVLDRAQNVDPIPIQCSSGKMELKDDFQPFPHHQQPIRWN